jgi:hypothetical protein
MVIVVAVAIGVVTPAGIARTHENGGGEIAASIPVAVTVAGAVGAPDRAVIRVIGTGAEGECGRGSERDGFPVAKKFLHAPYDNTGGGFIRTVFSGNFLSHKPLGLTASLILRFDPAKKL